MGLDMYLTRKVYVGLNYEHNRTGENKVVINGEEQDIESLKELCFEAAYWRKANAIHKWFVVNIQDGQDDCKEYYVDEDKLRELIEFCKKDIEYFNYLEYDMSEEIKDFMTGNKFTYKIYKNVEEDKLNLLTQGGFFFGSTDYDEYYVRYLQETIDMLEKALEKKGDFYYQSSW